MAAAAHLAAQPRVMVLPFLAQRHVIPLMELSRKLVEHGLEIDFVNTEFNHGHVLQALAEDGAIPGGVHTLSVPNGLGPADDHTDIDVLVKGLPAAMSGHLEEMIRSRKTKWMIAVKEICHRGNNKIIIYFFIYHDKSLLFMLEFWAPELATTAGVRVALFSTYAAAVFALGMNLPKVIGDSVVDESGNMKRHERVQLMPPTNVAEIPWASLGSTLERRRTNIQNVLRTNQLIPLTEKIICNTFMEMEPGALALLQNALPLSPLVAPTSRPTRHFLPEDLTCLAWLDAQAPGSIIYVAFGSSGVLDATQFQELADGLALSDRPFLWVVRPNFTTGATEGWFNAFKRHQHVLSHLAVTCFMSHCGWNSTMEGMLHGVPFLCWPYFADQFTNQSYLCRDKRGVVAKEEIESKVARLLGNEGFKVKEATWKDRACASIAEGGSGSNYRGLQVLFSTTVRSNILNKYNARGGGGGN
ncbi:hypothetical protein VPH35_085486 [Triticum aestivum]